jgi:hypothetical protein
MYPQGRRTRPWRYTMARVEGPVVAAIQGVAAENWLECCGEILTGRDYFPDLKACGDTTAFVIKSSPSDRATTSRVTIQLLIDVADRTVRVNTPYFLRDRALRKAWCDGGRGVAITVITGRQNTGSARQPAHGGNCWRRASGSSIPRRDRCAKVPSSTSCGRCSDDQHRQPVVQARRRQPGDARRGGRGAAARRLRARPRGQRNDAAGGAAGLSGEGRRTVHLDLGGSSDMTEVRIATYNSRCRGRIAAWCRRASWTCCGIDADVIALQE